MFGTYSYSTFFGTWISSYPAYCWCWGTVFYTTPSVVTYTTLMTHSNQEIQDKMNEVDEKVKTEEKSLDLDPSAEKSPSLQDASEPDDKLTLDNAAEKEAKGKATSDIDTMLDENLEVSWLFSLLLPTAKKNYKKIQVTPPRMQ